MAKKTYKEINGKTRVGAFLKKIATPETLSTILDVAGNVATGNWGGALKSITSSKTLTEDQKQIAIAELELDKAEAIEISKRWKSDMGSDSWLSKNIRPLVLGYLVLSMTVVMVLDSAGVLTVAEHWVSLLTSLLLTVIGGYFGLREVGKYVDKKYK